MRPLSRRESRLTALLILVGVIATVQLAIVGPIVAGFADRARERDDLTARYTRNNRIIAGIPRLRREAEARSQVMRDYVLYAPDGGSAAEQLRQRMQSAVLAAGGTFRGGEDIAAPPRTAGTRVTARLSWPQLLAMIARLQQERPYLTITSLAIGADDAAVSGQAGSLDVQLEATLPYSPAAVRR